jgi:hypothetical protein
MKVWEGGSETTGMAQRIHCEPVIGTWQGKGVLSAIGEDRGRMVNGDRREAYRRLISNWC